MIHVSCPASECNTHRQAYTRNPDFELIRINFRDQNAEFMREMTVKEAEKLANDLSDWVNEIKGVELDG